MEVSDEVMRGRQAWFWRRVTLQVVLVSFMVMLGWEVWTTAATVLGWTDVAVIITLVSAIVFLVSMYFAMVDNADKLSSVVDAIGDAVGDARGVGSNQ